MAAPCLTRGYAQTAGNRPPDCPPGYRSADDPNPSAPVGCFACINANGQAFEPGAPMPGASDCPNAFTPLNQPGQTWAGVTCDNKDAFVAVAPGRPECGLCVVPEVLYRTLQEDQGQATPTVAGISLGSALAGAALFATAYALMGVLERRK